MNKKPWDVTKEQLPQSSFLIALRAGNGEDLEIEDDIDDDTISLEDTENDVQVISDDVDELDIGESNPENVEEE